MSTSTPQIAGAAALPTNAAEPGVGAEYTPRISYVAWGALSWGEWRPFFIYLGSVLLIRSPFFEWVFDVSHAPVSLKFPPLAVGLIWLFAGLFQAGYYVWSARGYRKIEQVILESHTQTVYQLSQRASHRLSGIWVVFLSLWVGLVTWEKCFCANRLPGQFLYSDGMLPAMLFYLHSIANAFVRSTDKLIVLDQGILRRVQGNGELIPWWAIKRTTIRENRSLHPGTFRILLKLSESSSPEQSRNRGANAGAICTLADALPDGPELARFLAAWKEHAPIEFEGQPPCSVPA